MNIKLNLVMLAFALVIKTSLEIDSQYLCGETCSGLRKECSCEESCINEKTCCTDYQKNCIEDETAWVEDECASSQEMNCPIGYDSSTPLLLFSIDGFRNIYLDRNLTKVMSKLAQCGVYSPYMRPAYPSKTFTTHYTTITGLYAESHGIIDNEFYDRERGEKFALGTESSFDAYWWGGEPFWVTVSNQGLKSATYFYPGSDVNITRYPDYYYKYNESVPNEERIYQVLKWLDLPPNERPSFIAFYTHIVDTGGHIGGPSSDEVNEAIEEVDRLIGMLMDGLKMRNLQNCVNFIMVADHGMATTSSERQTFIEDYGVSSEDVYIRTGDCFARIGPSIEDENKAKEFDSENVLMKLQCKENTTHWQAYLKHEYLPKRLHYARNNRIEDVHLKMNDEWVVAVNQDVARTPSKGSHGYDNNYEDMRTVFIAHGLSLKRSFTSNGFESIELYNLLADLLNLTPAPNNGTTGSLSYLMQNPKEVNKEPSGSQPDRCDYPEGTDTSENNLGCSYCKGISEEEANRRLSITSDESDKYESKHMPYGQPRVLSQSSVKTSYCVLVQEDYVNAYDIERKLPRYVSFMKNIQTDGDFQSISCVRPDIRTTSQSACESYTKNENVTQLFLYDPALSNDKKRSDSELTTNTFPGFNKFTSVAKYMTKTINFWSEKYNGIHVTMGPVFDYNYDGLPDSDDVLLKQGRFLDDKSKETSTPIPTHIFLIITKCSDVTKSIDGCVTSPSDIDVLSFLIPNFEYNFCGSENIENEDVWMTHTLVEHVCRIKDIEFITGLRFFTKWTTGDVSQETLTSAIRQKVNLQQFEDDWLKEFQNQKLPSSSIRINFDIIIFMFSFVVSVQSIIH